jgi:aminoglycoside 3-N-acetyltransferase I
MDYTYARLSSEQVDKLKDLLRVFGEAFAELDTYQHAVPSNEYLRALLSTPQFVALVAVSEGEVIGGLAAYVLEKFEQERREIYIYDLAIQERYRRKGIATGLLHELKNVARQCGAYVIYVQADKADDAAIGLYESMGRKEDVFHFDIAP